MFVKPKFSQNEAVYFTYGLADGVGYVCGYMNRHSAAGVKTDWIIKVEGFHQPNLNNELDCPAKVEQDPYGYSHRIVPEDGIAPVSPAYIRAWIKMQQDLGNL